MTCRLALLAGVAALALAGCGGGGDDSQRKPAGDVSTDVAPAVGARTTTVEIVRPARGADDGGFDAAEIYEREAPGVVTVFSVLPGEAGLGGAGGQGLGTGFVLNARGEIATNAHVVTEGEGAVIRKAREVYVAFADGNEVSARIVGFDPNADVALLRIDPKGLTLRPLPLGTAEDLRVGSPVAAIGSPFGEPQSLSVGVVSATDRQITSLTGFEIAGAIQTDAAINRGNSGGPLVNARGEVLGINSQIQTASGGGDGVGYAVPVDTVRRTLAALRREGEVHYAYLGVATAPIYPQLARRFGLPVKTGAWVQEVVPGGPAEKAGLRAGASSQRFQARTVRVGGDIITAVDGRALEDEAALGVELLRLRPGQRATLRVYRDGRPRDVEVTLAERPQSSDANVRP
ncbi:MAG TPA: trypsin-like peptidase domain-containing protein [Solirubrobacteraceae bacterium]|nr:trypsin-like peptidase domain-containing protein [Solirubrobacteraceae bacterium]